MDIKIASSIKNIILKNSFLCGNIELCPDILHSLGKIKKVVNSF
jgi:hypothetical protein